MSSYQLDDDLEDLGEVVDDLPFPFPAALNNAITLTAPANAPGGSPIENLPRELLQMVMKSMDLETLLIFTQASKTIHAAHKQARALILHGVAEQTVGKELLPIAVNCLMAGSLRGLMWSQRPIHHDDDLPWYDPDVTLDFIDSYISKQASTLTLPPVHFGIFETSRLVSFHGKLLGLADEALQVFERRYANRNQQFVQYTREEKKRVLKALYLFELVFLILSPAQVPIDGDPRDRVVRNAFWQKFAPWDFEQMTHVVDTFLGPNMMEVANDRASHIKKDGYRNFHKWHNLRCNGFGRHDPTECIWHRITRPIKESSALSLLFQHGINGFLRVREDCYQYVMIDAFTSRENWFEWPNIESFFLRAGVDAGVAYWVPCRNHYPWSVSSPRLIEKRVKVLEKMFDKQDDCVFLAWLWRVISRNCRRPKELISDAEIGPEMVVECPHDMIFRSVGSMLVFGARSVNPVWAELEGIGDTLVFNSKSNSKKTTTSKQTTPITHHKATSADNAKMTNIGNDIKSGLKGFHGVGETLRGTVNEAADQALDSNAKHPASQESQLQNRGVAARGKAEVDGADGMIARHEAKHGGSAAQHQQAHTAGQPVEGSRAFRG